MLDLSEYREEGIYIVIENVTLFGDSKFCKLRFFIRLIHSHFVTTSYAHLSDIKVKEGAIIKAGDVIGISGNSETSNGPHLHFRIDYTNTSIKKK